MQSGIFHNEAVSLTQANSILGYSPVFLQRKIGTEQGPFRRGMPDAIRTHDLQSRSLTLYPAELRAHILIKIQTEQQKTRSLHMLYKS